MLIVKKSFILTLACIVIAATAMGLCAGAAASSANAVNASLPTVVVDAGHGGIDAGVLGVATGVKESDINLSIAKQLKGYFVNAGFNCVMTRTTQGGLYGSPTSGFKMRDMRKRKQIIEDADPVMVISVHQNSCPLPSRRGGQVFYDKSSEVGLALAQSIQTELNAMEQCVKQGTPLVGDYYMLKCTASASVIVECGFLTNAQDEALLITTEYQKAVAYAIFKGAVSYFGR